MNNNYDLLSTLILIEEQVNQFDITMEEFDQLSEGKLNDALGQLPKDEKVAQIARNQIASNIKKLKKYGPLSYKRLRGKLFSGKGAAMGKAAADLKDRASSLAKHARYIARRGGKLRK